MWDYSIPKEKPFFNRIDLKTEEEMLDLEKKLQNTHITMPMTFSIGDRIIGHSLYYRQKGRKDDNRNFT